MSFIGGGAPASVGSKAGFTGTQVQQSTFAKEGPQRLVGLEEATDLEQLRKDIEDGKQKIIERYIETFFEEPDEDYEQKINDHFQTLLVAQMLEKDIQVKDADSYYKLLQDYNREADYDDVDQVSQDLARDIRDNLLYDINSFFDGIGKMDGIEAAGAVENIGEFTTDIVEAIVDKNPKYGAIAVAELLGVEFDEEGNVSLENTIKDNAKPIIQKLMARYVIRPIKSAIEGFGAETAELEAELEPLIAEIAEEEAAMFEATIGEELAALAETEALALPGYIIGGIQATSAIINAVSQVLQAVNLTHDAYTKGNHTWADQNSGFIGFVKKIPLINELAESIAQLVAEAKDMRDYRKGETDAQKFLVEKTKREIQHNNEQDILNFLRNGTITYEDIRNGEKFSYIHTGPFGLKETRTVDLSNFKIENFEKRLESDIDKLKEDGVSELNNLEEHYDNETEKMLNNIPSSLRETLTFSSDGQILNWNPQRVRDMKKKVHSKRLGDILFRGGQRDEPISQEEFLNYVRHYNDYIIARKEVQAQRTKIQNM